MAEQTKEARIKRELDRLKKQFVKLDGRQKAVASSLIQNAAFMKVTLEDLQEIINSEGLIEEYQNGSNQKGVKQSAALQGYNALVKNYTAVLKTLGNMIIQSGEEKGATLGDLMADLMSDE